MFRKKGRKQQCEINLASFHSDANRVNMCYFKTGRADDVSDVLRAFLLQRH